MPWGVMQRSYPKTRLIVSGSPAAPLPAISSRRGCSEYFDENAGRAVRLMYWATVLERKFDQSSFDDGHDDRPIRTARTRAHGTAGAPARSHQRRDRPVPAGPDYAILGYKVDVEAAAIVGARRLRNLRVGGPEMRCTCSSNRTWFHPAVEHDASRMICFATAANKIERARRRRAG